MPQETEKKKPSSSEIRSAIFDLIDSKKKQEDRERQIMHERLHHITQGRDLIFDNRKP